MSFSSVKYGDKTNVNKYSKFFLSTPSIIQSLFLFIYDDFIMIMLSQSLLITIMCFLLYKMFKHKSFILLVVVFLFQYTCVVPTYNFMFLFMIVVLIYLEKYLNDNDFLIGIFLALSFLSKHVPGIFLVIPSIIFYRKDIKKLCKRFLGFLVPCSIFLIYLFVNGALYQFFDLCLFGMFDFITDNGISGGNIDFFYISITLITFIISIILMFKNKKDINLYYLIFGVFLAIPLFDITHTSMWLLCFMIMIIPYVNKYERVLGYLSLGMFGLFSIIWILVWNSCVELCFAKDLKHFKYNVQPKDTYENLLVVNDFINSYDDPIVLGYISMFYTITNDYKLNEFTILNRGNFGFDGTKKMYNKIDKLHNQVFLITIYDYENDDMRSQFSDEIVDYVIKVSKKIDEKNGFYVYYKE